MQNLIFFLLHFQGFSVRRLDPKESSSVYVTLGFAGIALVAAMLIGVAVIKKRNGRHPHHQVFSLTLFFPHSFSKNPLKYYFSREIPLTFLNSLVCITLKRKEKIITLNEYLGEEQFGIVIKCFHVTKMMMVIRFDSLIHVPAV